MAIILSLPAGVRNPADETWDPVPISQTMTSPLSAATQTAELAPARWKAALTYRTVPESNWRLWMALKAQLRGQANRLYVGPFVFAKPRGLAGGAPVVNGNGQTGNTLNVRGCTASQSPWLKVGDLFHYASPNWQQMHIVVGADVASDSGGHAALTIEPAIRESPSDGAPIVTASPQCIMGLVTDDLPLKFTPPAIAEFTVQLEERFS